MYLEYNENYVDPVELAKSIKAVGAEFQCDQFATVEEAIIWIKDNTDLIETSPGTFLIADSYNDPIMGEIAKRELVIE